MEVNPRIRVLTAGHFHPLRKGHIRHFQQAKKLANNVRLIVLVNSDEDVIRKHGVCAMDQAERMELVRALGCVDEVQPVIDKDGTIAKTILRVKPDIFAKGGDRTRDNMPDNEIAACRAVGCTIVFGVGKQASSSFKFLTDIIDAKDKIKYNPV